MKFLDLFSGIGGFRLGMELSGHECVGHVEYDASPQSSYMAMYDVKESEFNGKDIRNVRADELPGADCWCFGAPCQDFSIAGKRKGLDGDRSSLVREVFRLIRETPEENRPEWLFYENVKGMLSSNGGRDFLGIILELDELGYDAEWQTINSKHHGVAQSRERVYVIGHSREAGTRSILPIEESTHGVLRGVQADTSGKGHNSQQDRFYMTDGVMCCLPKARANTKCCTCDPDGNLHILTAKERMRIQGFPDELTDKALTVTSESDLSEQAGNSVTVNVIHAISKRFKED